MICNVCRSRFVNDEAAIISQREYCGEMIILLQRSSILFGIVNGVVYNTTIVLSFLFFFSLIPNKMLKILNRHNTHQKTHIKKMPIILPNLDY